MIVRLDRHVVIAAILLAAGASPAVSQEKITLRLADSLPNGHVIHERSARSQPAACLCQPARFWMRLFDEADIPHAPLHDLDGLIDDPHLAAVGLLQSIEHPTEGTLRVAGPAATWSKTPPSIRQYPPRLGEHGGEILREAGFSGSDIEALVAEGAVVESDPHG